MSHDEECRTVNAGDSVFLGHPEGGVAVVDRVKGPNVFVLWEYEDDSGIERSEYLEFRCYDMDWDGSGGWRTWPAGRMGR